jgi:hypothetical protein
MAARAGVRFRASRFTAPHQVVHGSELETLAIVALGLLVIVLAYGFVFGIFGGHGGTTTG